MKKDKVIIFLMNPKKWWLPLVIILTASAIGVTYIGFETYHDAPPIPDFKDTKGNTVIASGTILQGQEIFHKYALMDHGSMFGDGGLRGPDYSAESLHLLAEYMYKYFLRISPGTEEEVLKMRIRKEIKKNSYEATSNSATLSNAQLFAVEQLTAYYTSYFREPGRVGIIPAKENFRALSAFFFWSAWVCGTERPGESYSYTHNWPFDPDAGNTLTPGVIFWSIIGALGFIVGLGVVLNLYGRLENLTDESLSKGSKPLFSLGRIASFRPDDTQRASFKYFYAAMALFVLQVAAGVLTVHDFVGLVNFSGYDISRLIPVTISRSWHLQLALFWISACWIGASIFILPMVSAKKPKHQLLLVNLLFALFALMAAGSLTGIFAGPKGMLGNLWRELGHQGWEFVELGRVYQFLLFAILVLWTVIIVRGVWGSITIKQPWALPNWLVYTTVFISCLFISGFISGPDTNFVIADFWRWCVIHMWVEAFFEVFTTVLAGCLMVLMGLVNIQSVIRVVYLGTLLFLGSGLLGISHNFYWNAKPIATVAIGSVFSTLQVIPLILLTLEAARFKRMPESALGKSRSTREIFGMQEVFLFLTGVNFWNFWGAGVFGFIINLPVVNYFEHGTYLTVNHGHAALMGVYGNLSLAVLLFCCKLLIRPESWNSTLPRIAFWSINGGLVLMVLLDLFPAGLHQLNAVLQHGLWFSRSQEFVSGSVFQSLTWLRIAGGSVFVLGGLFPLAWFMASRASRLKAISPADQDIAGLRKTLQDGPENGSADKEILVNEFK